MEGEKGRGRGRIYGMREGGGVEYRVWEHAMMEERGMSWALWKV